MRNLYNKKVAVVGFGITGRSAAEYLLKRGARVSVLEKNQVNNNMRETIKSFKTSKRLERVVSGKDYLSTLSNYNLIVLSPGVNPLLPEITKAKACGIPIHNDVTLFLEEWKGRGPTIGITGSNGKSTTATLIYELIKSNDIPVKIGGSIGISPLKWLDEEIKDGTHIVLEVGSALLECFTSNYYFDIVVITNISSNHLDRYPNGIEEYAQVKLRIVRKNHTILISNTEDFGVQKFIEPKLNDIKYIPVCIKPELVADKRNRITLQNNKEVVYQSGRSVDMLLSDIKNRKIQGTHNIYNIMCSLGVLKSLGITVQHNDEVIKNFNGLPHRIEFITQIKGIKYFNDSKSTSPDATNKALEMLGCAKNIILIAGGDDKNMDFLLLKDVLAKYAVTVILLPGTASKKLKRLASKPHCNCSVLEVATMREAVLSASQNASRNDIVLLSPAAGSTSQFKNFEARGRSFLIEVNNHAKNI